MNKSCLVCQHKNNNWLHELSCRSKNILAWLLFDFIMARKDETAKIDAIKRYWDTSSLKTE